MHGFVFLASQGISRLSLKNIMQWYLDNIGEEKGCRNLACMPDDNIRQHIQCSNCFIASYGADNDTGFKYSFVKLCKLRLSRIIVFNGLHIMIYIVFLVCFLNNFFQFRTSFRDLVAKREVIPRCRQYLSKI